MVLVLSKVKGTVKKAVHTSQVVSSLAITCIMLFMTRYTKLTLILENQHLFILARVGIGLVIWLLKMVGFIVLWTNIKVRMVYIHIYSR